MTRGRRRRRAWGALLLAGLLGPGGCGPNGREGPARTGGPLTPDGPAPEGSRYVASIDPAEAAARGTIYVPVYSHIYIADNPRPYLLSATLSIRNTDPARPVVIDEVRYGDTAGAPVRAFLTKSLELGPLAGAEFFVRQSDRLGGSGAHALVRWSARAPVSPPLVEAVMIGATSAQGISFSSRGIPIEPPAASPRP
jgi:hypothetical protein